MTLDSLKALVKPVLRSDRLYQLCNRYVNFYRNDNNGNPHNNGEFALLQRTLSPANAPIVFDIGANVGEWALQVQRLNRSAHIHCFEPCADTFATLQANLSQQLGHPITANHLALGSTPDSLELQIYGATSALNSLYSRAVLGQVLERQVIQVDTIDRYCQRQQIDRIHFCKLDVEGHELEVLKGAEQLISAGAIDVIQFEYGGTYIDAGILLKDIFEFFASSPYRLFKMFPNALQAVASYHVGLETFQYSNWVALRDSDCRAS